MGEGFPFHFPQHLLPDVHFLMSREPTRGPCTQRYYLGQAVAQYDSDILTHCPQMPQSLNHASHPLPSQEFHTHYSKHTERVVYFPHLSN
jgi:hypothetical protein